MDLSNTQAAEGQKGPPIFGPPRNEKRSEAPVATLNNCRPVPPQAAANKESSRAQQQALALRQQCTEHLCVLEAQLAALEQARAADQAAAEREAVSEEGSGPG